MSSMHMQEPISLTSMSLPHILEEITKRICAVSQPERIILFGSCARNDQNVPNDIDLLVIMPHVESTRQESMRLLGALRDLIVPVDILVATPQQIERHRQTPGLIYATILQEGKIIYDTVRTSYG